MSRENWTEEEKREALINNDLDWYLVDYLNGTTDLQHSTSLSSILECGHKNEDYGISEMYQCWNGEDLEIGV